MNFKTLEVEIRESVAVVALNRPEALNALDLALGEDLGDALKDLRGRPDVRAILLTGAGRAFCAGGDIKQMLPGEGRKPADFFEKPLRAFHEVILAIRGMPKPVVAAVNGFASGAGCNLALACDYRIAGEGARFNQAFVRIGLVPDCGGTFLLPRIVGWARAAELILTGRMVEAREALAMGLVHEVVADDQLRPVAMKVAGRLAAGPTLAYARAKYLLDRSANAGLEDQLEAERMSQVALGPSADFLEGLRAFVEKRPARFEGR